jgi:hypothetical protein
MQLDRGSQVTSSFRLVLHVVRLNNMSAPSLSLNGRVFSRSPDTYHTCVGAAVTFGLIAFVGVQTAHAQRIENQVAVFAALDKVTARIQKLEVKLGETQKFGALKITPRTCYSRPPTEPPKTTTFVEVEETELDGKQKKLFAGWMFAESPGLNAVEHPVYDVWLTECTGPKAAPVAAVSAAGRPGAGATSKGAQTSGTPPAVGPNTEDDPNARRRRPPR